MIKDEYNPPTEEDLAAAGYQLYTSYDPATGRVTGIGDAPMTSLSLGIPGSALLIGAKLDQATEYVDLETGERAERPGLALAVDKDRIIADGADTATIAGVPAGATIVVRGETFTADGGSVEYSTVQPGLHQLRVFAFPARDEVVTINAH